MLRSPFIPPCLPTLRDRLPKGEGWFYEVKFDGYRMQVHKTGERVTLFTRNGADWTSRLPHLAACLTMLPCSSAIIDAELIHMDGFDELHRRVNKRADDEQLLWAFDLMQLNGDDLRALALADRKRRLGHLIERAGIARLRHSETFEDGERCSPNATGVGSRASSPSTKTAFTGLGDRLPGSRSKMRSVARGQSQTGRAVRRGAER